MQELRGGLRSGDLAGEPSYQIRSSAHELTPCGLAARELLVSDVMEQLTRAATSVNGTWPRPSPPDPPRLRKLRIAQVSPLYERVPPRQYGGTERIVGYLCNGLARRGHDVTLFASGDSRTAARLC